MDVLENFKVPRHDGLEYLVYVIDRGIYQETLYEPKQHLYFCLCEEFYKCDIRIERIVNFNGSYQKILNSDVVIEKIGDDYIVLKNRYGFNSDDQVKILATPTYK